LRHSSRKLQLKGNTMNGQLVTALTMILVAALSGVTAKLGLDSTTTLALSGAIASGIGVIALATWRVMLRSDNAIIAEAAKIIAPTGGVILTTTAVANAVPNTNVIRTTAEAAAAVPQATASVTK
jgi:hypothetical protein